jgi:hypothetical protein
MYDAQLFSSCHPETNLGRGYSKKISGGTLYYLGRLYRVPFESLLRVQIRCTIHRSSWFGFFWPPTPLYWHFYGINIDKKLTFLDYLPTSSCKRSLRTTSKSLDNISKNNMEAFTKCNLWKIPTHKIVFWGCKIYFLTFVFSLLVLQLTIKFI